MLDIDDFIRQSLRSAKFAIAEGETLKEFRQSLRSVVSPAICMVKFCEFYRYTVRVLMNQVSFADRDLALELNIFLKPAWFSYVMLELGSSGSLKNVFSDPMLCKREDIVDIQSKHSTRYHEIS